ncbi:capsid maturation protease [Arthrobacter phage SWEP2]|uniref:Capsid maturation protease n=1 Tax=Arthrobacter phage SWEP2 TaxID=2945958 RepID=A0A9E7MHR5_9CAUD|nr:capsid maturation protease [Arthrobacter phage SWEP2]
MANVFFTSDLHLGHDRVARIRGFDHTANHDLALVDRWRAVVRPDDHVWILGDIAASSPVYALAILRALPGIKHLVAGNHDRVHPMHRDAYRQQERYLEVFASVQSSARRRVLGQEVLLSHFPYDRDRNEVRYAQWRLPDHGVPLLHGHTHGLERLSRSARSTAEVHVGVDAWDLSPVPLSTVEGLLAEAVVVA